MSTIFPPPLLRRFPNSCNSRGGPAVLPLCATKFRLPKPFRGPCERKSGSPPLRGRPPMDKQDLPEQKYLRLRRNCRESGFTKNFVGLSINRRAEYLPAGRRALDFQFEARRFALAGTAKSRGFRASGHSTGLRCNPADFRAQKPQGNDFCSGERDFPTRKNAPSPAHTPPDSIKPRKGFRPLALS